MIQGGFFQYDNIREVKMKISDSDMEKLENLKKKLTITYKMSIGDHLAYADSNQPAASAIPASLEDEALAGTNERVDNNIANPKIIEITLGFGILLS